MYIDWDDIKINIIASVFIIVAYLIARTIFWYLSECCLKCS